MTTTDTAAVDAASAAVSPAPIGQRLRRIWPYFSQSPSAWAIAIGATVVASATEPLIPALLQPLLDKGFGKGGIDIVLKLTADAKITVDGKVVKIARPASKQTPY